MQQYTDSPDNFNLIQANEQAPITKRNMGIFDMVMNRLGLPDHLHEFVRAVFIAGNWDRIEGWDEISLGRMAGALATDAITQVKVLNRLKKNSPKFFKWQDEQTFTIIDRVILREHGTHYKTKAKYLFVLYDLIEKLFNIPKKSSKAAVRMAVEKALKDFPIVEKPKRKTRRKKAESVASSLRANINELNELTGSMSAASLYALDGDFEGKVCEFAKTVLLQTKNLSAKV